MRTLRVRGGSSRGPAIATTFAASFLSAWSFGQVGRPVLAQRATPWMDAQRLLAECSAPVDSRSYNSCIDYMEGVKDILNYLREHRVGGIRFACTPPNITLGQLHDVAVTFIQRNPQFYHMPAAQTVYAALISAFPCE